MFGRKERVKQDLIKHKNAHIVACYEREIPPNSTSITGCSRVEILLLRGCTVILDNTVHLPSWNADGPKPMAHQ